MTSASSSSAPCEHDAQPPVPVSPTLTAAAPLAPQSPYVVISSASNSARGARGLRVPSSDDGTNTASAEAVVAASNQGSPLLASRRHTALIGDESPSARHSVLIATTPRVSRARPRFWYFLPLLSIIDVALEGIVGVFLLLNPGPSLLSAKKHSDDEAPSLGRTRTLTLTSTLLAASLLRNATLSIIAIGNRTDQLGLIVAGVCAASALVGVSVFNLLFQSGVLLARETSQDVTWPEKLPKPSLTLLTSLGLGFTVLEYVLYVLVVGIRVPPSAAGGVGRMGQVRRWKRGMRSEAARAGREGDEGSWAVYLDDEEDDDMPAGQEEPRKKRRQSYVGSSGERDGEGQGSSGTSAEGSRMSLLPEAVISPSTSTGPSSSYGALEQSRPLSSLLPQSAFSTQGGQGTHRSSSSRARTTSTTSARSGGRSPRNDKAMAAAAVGLSASPSGSKGMGPHSPIQRDYALATSGGNDVDLEAGPRAPFPMQEGDDSREDEERDDDEDDPNEILDIPSFPTSTSRDASRMRLAMASDSRAAQQEGRRSSSGLARSGSRTLSLLGVIRGGNEDGDGGQVEEPTAGGSHPDEEAEAVPQRRKGWRTSSALGAKQSSLLGFKRKKPQRDVSGPSVDAAADAGSGSTAKTAGWRAGGKRLLKSAMPGASGTGGSSSGRT
ncbi:hypothetical protein BDZ90DRAFT_262409 [Jaminaea rosea]|uniref:Uncharacterized protein n=1 Tax=Jaminaea rosea TaxID=1569628 RepID=A0A316UJB4_9BASI|nr:hypothetical protein BDZ90DRAFT_262409 [Jaminaea rosea]PWN25356.1 hypothetical protein BDZ90DRAFT_262409 [Jaminaea rosea]